jgi:hypothetical protein
MDSEITAEQFLSAWRMACAKKMDLLVEQFNGSYELYSSYVFSGDSSIVDDVSKQLSLECQREYYRIDVAFIKPGDRIIDAPGWLHRIRIAFEHEHLFGHAFEEVAKMMLIDADLRVVVSYPFGTSTRKAGVWQKLHRIVAESHRVEDIAAHRRLLVITGALEMEPRGIEWLGFVFRKDGWVDLQSGIRGLSDEKLRNHPPKLPGK